jgi:peptide/nickel transport system permease protein
MTLRSVCTRLARFVATVFVVTFVTAVLLNLVPGSPASVMAGPGASPQAIAAINQEYGFNKPTLERYFSWLAGLLHGNLGISYVNRQPIFQAIMQRLPVTAELIVLAMLLAIVIAVVAAVYSAQRVGSTLDRMLEAYASMVISIPSFVIAMVLIYVLVYKARILPAFGWVPLSGGVLSNLQHAVLPVVAIALPESVVLLRVLRADMINIMQQDYVLLAQAKGLPPRRVMWNHVLRPASLSLVTISGLAVGQLIGGTVVVETVFSLPGIGSFLLQSIQSKDLVAVQGCVAFIAIAFLLINLAIDTLLGVVDPRLRVAR